MRDNTKLHATIHYLDQIRQNSSMLQPEIRTALDHAISILYKLDDTTTLEKYLNEVYQE